MNTLHAIPDPDEEHPMRAEAYRELQVLEEIARTSDLSQRSLAGRLGIAVGLANLVLRRMAKKGYIKITNIEKKRLRYLLTPEGIAEKSRLTYEYFDASLYLYRKVRRTLHGCLTRFREEGAQAVVLYGAGELAEVAYLSVQDTGLTLAGVVADAPGAAFLGRPVLSVSELPGLTFDCVIVTSLDAVDMRLRRLAAAGVAEKKVVVIEREGPRIRAVAARFPDEARP